VIDEVNMENWGFRGEQVSEIRKQAARIKGSNNE
jgi:phenylpyruvate tautomerase PptA (4-oxalocrotonate tautomerase family)